MTSERVVLPALHYLPRQFVTPWTPGFLIDNSTRPSYISIGGNPVTFCLCGRVRDVFLAADDGGPVEDVRVELAPIHHNDGSAIVQLVRQAGYHERDGMGSLVTVPKNMLTRDTSDDPWKLVSFTNVYDAATNVYPYRTEQTKIDPRNIDCGDIVIAEGRIVCKERALPGMGNIPDEIRARIAANVTDGRSLRSLSLSNRSWRIPAMDAQFYSVSYSLGASGKSVDDIVKFFTEKKQLGKAVRTLTLGEDGHLAEYEAESLDIHKCMTLVALFPGLLSLSLRLTAWTAPTIPRPMFQKHARLRHLLLDVVWRVKDSDPAVLALLQLVDTWRLVELLDLEHDGLLPATDNPSHVTTLRVLQSQCRGGLPSLPVEDVVIDSVENLVFEQIRPIDADSLYKAVDNNLTTLRRCRTQEWWLPAFRSMANAALLEYVCVDVPLDMRSTSVDPEFGVTRGAQLECLYSMVRYLPSSVQALELHLEVAYGVSVSTTEKLLLRINWHLLGLYLKAVTSLQGVVIRVSDFSIGTGAQYAKAEALILESFSDAGLRESDQSLLTRLMLVHREDVDWEDFCTVLHHGVRELHPMAY
ncbi:hypothetical protein EIP86_000446 [Pleurotus ostreatoroseus]|nr:hypothetical protein EIP86_000446 [Pleurotus ostreatoroseus]